jgi:alpha-1,6-mannosyltransferase
VPWTLKILHLANFYHPKSGGIKTYLDAKRRFFEERGLPFRLVIPADQDGIERCEPDTVIYSIGSPLAPFNRLYRLIVNLGTVHKIVKLEKPDLIEVNDKYTLMALSFFYRKVQKRLPIAGFHHERFDVNISLYFGDNRFWRRFASLFMRVVSAAFDRIFCASRFTAEEIEPIAPDKIELLHLGIDLETFRPGNSDPKLRERFAGDADPLLLYVGRIAREKNIMLLPEVMVELERRGKNARLVVAGVGELARELREAGKGRISLLGYVSDRELLAGIYSSADVFVFPSPQEPYGLVPLEALAAGLPVVCPDRGGVREYSDSPAVLAVKPTAEAFAEAIIELTNGDRDSLHKLARAQAERFPWEKTFERQLVVFEEMIRRGVTGSTRR